MTPQKYIIDKNYEICRGCHENYIRKSEYQCRECALGQALEEMKYFQEIVEACSKDETPLIKTRPMKPNSRHPGNR